MMQLGALSEINLTHTSIYRNFLTEDNITKSSTSSAQRQILDSDEESFDLNILTLEERAGVECHYVQSFNASIVKQVADTVST
jgi:hypothetical protein